MPLSRTSLFASFFLAYMYIKRISNYPSALLFNFPSYDTAQRQRSNTSRFCLEFFFQIIASFFFVFNSSTHLFLGQLKLFSVVSHLLAFSLHQPPPMLSHWQVPLFYTTSSRSSILGVKSAVLTLILLCSSRH